MTAKATRRAVKASSTARKKPPSSERTATRR